LEMNTRLQVEHPVTEMVTGLDLVQWQIKIAAGQPIPFSQGELTQRGHAIECRLYAEDAANGFLPATGQILALIEPVGPGIRLDSGIALGSQISHHYDPLLAKLIVYGEQRPDAIRRMQSALRQMAIHGVTTNLDFLQAVLAHPDYQAGSLCTSWVESEYLERKPASEIPFGALIAAAITENTLARDHAQERAATSELDPYSPWKTKQ